MQEQRFCLALGLMCFLQESFPAGSLGCFGVSWSHPQVPDVSPNANTGS